jgi:fructosamine-3-kinase
MFTAEFEALSLLAATGAIRVPKPIVAGDDFLVLEAFRSGGRKADWLELIGRQLAQLHQGTRRGNYGFMHDNYLGTTPQPNAWMDNWLSFWSERRLEWQLSLFARRTNADDPLLRLGKQLLARLDKWLGPIREPAVLLHGDLWCGNAAADESGDPIIYDPASYYGHHEAEIGMMRLFGGFGPRCESAYAEIWPLEPGADERITLYRLYHELNHLNLFGRGYYAGCLATIRQLL